MRKKLSALLLIMLALGAVVVACGEEEVREKEPDSNVIRIYDVEPQEVEDFTNVQHYVRLGIFADFEDGTNSIAPFANQIKQIEEETGAEIEYVVFDNWEELRQAEREFEDANVTEMILFNNTYDGSLIKDVASGPYADMEAALEEYGLYDAEAYEQTVMEAGRVEGQQTLVPILYNVPGMVHGEEEFYPYEEWKKVAYAHAENDHIAYEEFLDKLKEAMVLANVEEMDLPFMSTGFLKGNVDLYLTAAGGKWETYAEQHELFELLYDYLSTYQETQVESKEDTVSNQALIGKYIEEYQYTPMNINTIGHNYEFTYLPNDVVEQLKIERSRGLSQEDALITAELAATMLNRTEYLVECSGAEDIAFHSVLGLLRHREYYGEAHASGIGLDFQISRVKHMQYWPIGMMGEDALYAAQPICYAAVVDGGSTRLGARVIQSMMNQLVDGKYGFSTCNATREKQLQEWISGSALFGHIRSIKYNEDGTATEAKEGVYWSTLMGSTGGGYMVEDREMYISQVEEQLGNVAVAQIPDREILSIWQDTLTESVESGLSAQSGFELLCERMDAWYEE